MIEARVGAMLLALVSACEAPWLATPPNAAPAPSAVNVDAAGTPGPVADEGPRPGFDRTGDPLPAGAIARLGSRRFRHGAPILHAAWAAERSASAGKDGVRVWDAEGRPIFEWLPESGEEPHGVALSHGGGIVAFSTGREVRVHRVPRGDEIHRVTHARRLWPEAIAMSADGARLAVAHNDAVLRVYRVSNGEVLRLLGTSLPKIDSAPRGDRVDALRFTPDGRLVASARDGKVTVWDVHHRKVLQRIDTQVEFGAVIAVGEETLVGAEPTGSLVRVFDLTTGKETSQFRLRGTIATAAALSADERVVAIAQDSGHVPVVLYDVATGKVLAPRRGPMLDVSALRFAADGRIDAAIGHALVHWKAKEEPAQEGPAPQPLGGLSSLAFTADSESLLAAGDDGEIWRWDLESQKRTARLFVEPTEDFVGDDEDGWRKVGVSPIVALLPVDDDRIFTVHRKASAMREWSLAKGRIERGTHAFESWGNHGASLPSAGLLVTVGREGDRGDVVKVWDPETLKPTRILDHAYDHGQPTVAIGPKGELIASGNSGEIRLWALATGKDLGTLDHGNAITALAFHPSAPRLVSADHYGFLRRWNLDDKKQTKDSLLRPISGWTSLTYAPDGKLLVGGKTERGRLYVVDAETLKPLRELDGHAGAVRSVVFSPDGRLVATAGDDTSILVWPVAKLRQAGTPPKGD